jgi:hypothetical protein
MRSIRNLKDLPAGRALMADDLLEFHAARLLLLHRLSGVNNRIDGLTKVAKLDFFARYPAFFAEACEALGQEPPPITHGVEAPMVRHHYGPWDKRYYHVLAFLEGTGLLRVTTQPNGSYSFALTTEGALRADALCAAEPFETLVAQMRHIKRVLGSRSGDSLKKFIYEQFDHEVASLLLGEVIQ